MERLWKSWSILHTFALLFLSLHHHSTGCYARMWRMMNEEPEEVAEVVHLIPSSFLLYRRQLQTGTYCVASSSDDTLLQAALDWACAPGQGNVDCSSLQTGGSCYNPNTVAAHASYAFNSYYIAQNAVTGSCSFNGLATTTTTNPSSGTCVFQAYTGSTGGSAGPPPPPGTGTFAPTPTGTIFSPPANTTTPVTNTNSAPPPSSITLPWLYALCGGILLITLSSRQ